MVHTASAACNSADLVALNRLGMGISWHGGNAIILVRETDRTFHGGQDLTDLMKACPERIGCANHVMNFDDACEDCMLCPLNIRKVLHQHASTDARGGNGGVIDWMRAKDFKLVSLKQIVQQLLTASLRGDIDGTEDPFCGLRLAGEVTSKSFHMPAHQPKVRVLMHSGCHLSDELPALLQTAVPGIEVGFVGVVVGSIDDRLNHPSADDIRWARASEATGGWDPKFSSDELKAGAADGIRLLVVVHDGVFEDPRVVASLRMALNSRVPCILVHEADTNHRGCDFGMVIQQCPPGLNHIKGFDNMELFGPIAVGWTRGAHQLVSVLELAQALGAAPEQRRLLGACGCFGSRRRLLGACGCFGSRRRSATSTGAQLFASNKTRSNRLLSWAVFEQGPLKELKQATAKNDGERKVSWSMFKVHGAAGVVKEAPTILFSNPLHDKSAGGGGGGGAAAASGTGPAPIQLSVRSAGAKFAKPLARNESHHPTHHPTRPAPKAAGEDR